MTDIIYRLIDVKSGRTFYVGITRNVKQRFYWHKRKFPNDEIKLVPICQSNCRLAFLLEWYFIDYFRQTYDLINRRNFFTKPVSTELSLIDFCVRHSISHVEILDFSIFSK